MYFLTILLNLVFLQESATWHKKVQKMSDDIKKINCVDQSCPFPLIKTREAVMKGKKGDSFEITGTHLNSFKEIPMALESMDVEILEESRDEESGIWKIIFKI